VVFLKCRLSSFLPSRTLRVTSDSAPGSIRRMVTSSRRRSVVSRFPRRQTPDRTGHPKFPKPSDHCILPLMDFPIMTREKAGLLGCRRDSVFDDDKGGLGNHLFGDQFSAKPVGTI